MNISTCQEQTAPDAAAVRDGGASTLIEFPVAGRSPRPQWRKDLSERVREIQQRRAVEAAGDAQQAATGADAFAAHLDDGGSASLAPQLGLVPQPEAPEVNPIVARALEKIERARKASAAPATRQATRGGEAAAAAAARVEDVSYPAPEPSARQAAAETSAPAVDGVASAASAEAEKVAPTAEPARARTLVVVPPQPTGTDAAISEALNRPRPRRHIPEVADDALLQRREAGVAPAASAPAPSRAERAPISRRVAAAVVDLLVVAFASSPFAAIIELTSGGWQDWRVAACLAGIVLTIMFMYQTVAVAFSGRTLGMRLASLRVVDARTGLIPTAGQCARRALVLMLSLAALGIGLLLALFDAEGRSTHDHLSRTTVVKE